MSQPQANDPRDTERFHQRATLLRFARFGEVEKRRR